MMRTKLSCLDRSQVVVAASRTSLQNALPSSRIGVAVRAPAQRKPEELDRPSSSCGRPSSQLTNAATLAFALSALTTVFPEPGHAEEMLSGTAFDVFAQFLEHIEALGPLGCVLFVGTVMVCEMVPLLPTQPLSLSAGLLFGPTKGAALVLLGALLAAVNAYWISRGIGGPFVQSIVDSEMKEGEGKAGGGGAGAKLAEVQAVIESGGFWQQFGAITLMRLTPVVPFSASNYVLGLTPVQPAAFVLGTIVGTGFWSTVYASLGGASRQLFKDGDTEIVFRDLGEKAAEYSQTVGIGAACMAAVAAAYFGGQALLRSRRDALLHAARRDGQESGGKLPEGSAKVPPMLGLELLLLRVVRLTDNSR